MKQRKGIRIVSFILVSLMVCGILSGMPVFAQDDSLSESVQTVEDLADGNIGALTGSVFDLVAKKFFPECTVSYYNSNTDGAVALEEGKIDAYLCDEPTARIIARTYSDLKTVETLSREEYAAIFQKGSDDAAKLCAEVNEFIAKGRENGFFEKLDAKWFGTNESEKVIDLSQMEHGVNGTLNFGTCSEVGEPFGYIKDGQYAGYDIEFAVEFCRAYGYGIHIIDYSFSGLLNAVQSGKIDFAASCITVTEERKESILFSDANYFGGSVVMMRVTDDTNETGVSSVDDLAGGTIGVLTGSIFDVIAADHVPNCTVNYFNSNTDISVAMAEGKIDAYVTDEPIARILGTVYPDQKIIETISRDEYAFIFRKDDERADKLCSEMNEFIAESKANGFFEKLDTKWFGTDENTKVIDFSQMEQGINGTLNFATSSETGEPFSYIKDGQFAGFDVEVAVEFCRAYGYGINIVDYSFASLLNAVQSGKADFAAACITVTEERKESVLFSDADYTGGTVVVTKSGAAKVAALSDSGDSTEQNPSGFFASVKDSFQKTFIRESRWKLFAEGILYTMFISVLSIVFGSVLGFLTFMWCRRGNRLANFITRILIFIIHGMPVVVLLMIMYYLILGNTNLGGAWVSVVTFTFTFAASVFGMLKSGVSAIDIGQYEAAFSLGFKNRSAFLKIILPQAAQYFFPMLRSEVVSHIKATAVVGYIAVTDLTKMSDIVRSRTYEAFFPLIAIAIIYFVLEFILVSLVKAVQLAMDRKRRTPEQILKGVVTK